MKLIEQKQPTWFGRFIWNGGRETGEENLDDKTFQRNIKRKTYRNREWYDSKVA